VPKYDNYQWAFKDGSVKRLSGMTESELREALARSIDLIEVISNASIEMTERIDNFMRGNSDDGQEA